MPKMGGDTRRPIMMPRADALKALEDMAYEIKRDSRDKRTKMGNILSVAGYLLAIALIAYLVWPL